MRGTRRTSYHLVVNDKDEDDLCTAEALIDRTMVTWDMIKTVIMIINE